MNYIVDGIVQGLMLLIKFDKEVVGIAFLSVKVSVMAVLLSSFIAVPFGVAVALGKFSFKRLLVMVLNSMMSVPSVLIGLLVFAMLSNKGALGSYHLLYTPLAMVVGQALLAFPIIAALSVSAVEGLDTRVKDTLLTLGANGIKMRLLMLYECKTAIAVAVMTGFGRVFGEVGAAMMLGGNIKGYTRSITTAIALETGKGEFALGVALGVVLLAAAFAANYAVYRLKRYKI